MSVSDKLSDNPFFNWVTFKDVPDNYLPGQDIFVVYELGDGFRVCSNDWVGLYRSDTLTDIHHYIAFERSSKKPRNPKFPQIRSCLFLARNLKSVSDGKVLGQFQFLYIHKGCQIVGMSRRFTITNKPLPMVQVVDEIDRTFGKVTYIDVVKSGSPEDIKKNESGATERNDEQGDEFEIVNDADETEQALECGQEDSQKWDIVPSCATNDGEDWLTPGVTRKLKPASSYSISMPSRVYDQIKEMVLTSQKNVPGVPRCLPQPGPDSCSQCRLHNRQILSLSRQKQALNSLMAEMKQDLADKNEILEMKEWLLNVLSEQLKLTIDENTNLRLMKGRLERSLSQKSYEICRNCTKMSRRLVSMRDENTRLKHELASSMIDMKNVQDAQNQREMACREMEMKLLEKCGEIEQNLSGLFSALIGTSVNSNSCTQAMNVTLEQMVDNISYHVFLLGVEISSEMKKAEELKTQLTNQTYAYQQLVTSKIELSRNHGELLDRVGRLEQSLNAEQRRRNEQNKQFRQNEADLHQRINSLSAKLENMYVKQKPDTQEKEAAGQSLSTLHQAASSQTDNDQEFSFGKFLSDTLEAMSSQFGMSEDNTSDLPTDVSVQLDIDPFDYYPSDLPEPSVSRWSPAPLCDGPPNTVAIDDISLGNAAGKAKVLLDFRDKNSTREVLVANSEEHSNKTNDSSADGKRAASSKSHKKCSRSDIAVDSDTPAPSDLYSVEKYQKTRRGKRNRCPKNVDKSMMKNHSKHN